jgi:hypothetical protein
MASGAIKMSLLINKKKCKQALLDCARDTRAHKYTRVSESTLIHLEAVVKNEIEKIVRTQPSAGKTIIA